MCGIAGYIGFRTINHNRREQILNKMLTRISHRGPDECGLFLSPDACFGNVRLSIIDLSSGQQPLCNEDGNLWIAYNGEVFNYLELREVLIHKGHKFKTHCDTEVVLHLYQEYGPDCLSMLNGQFSIAIWDIQKKEMFLARDRMGIRPLFYFQNGAQLVFGSEIKSIFEFPGVERRISIQSLKQVVTFWTTITPDTIFENIFEIPPAHYAIFKGDKLEIKPFWSLQFSKENGGFKGSVDEATEQFQELFSDSVKLRLRADVPVAAYLSGGLDSSITTSFVKQLFPNALHTFSIGFEDKDFDESSYQREVADYFQTNHHAVTFQNQDVSGLLEKVVWHCEIPLLRAGPIPMYKLSGLVRDHQIKVVVTGEGADEALGGYNIFKETLIRHFWARYPDSKVRPLLLKRLYQYIPQLREASPSMLKMFFGYQLTNTQSAGYSHLLRWKNNGNIANHFSPFIKSAMAGYDPVELYVKSISDKMSGLSPLAKAQYIESTVFMSGYLLSSQGDRVAMGHSVEGRYPFLDYRILEFCATLPDHFKLNGLNEKYLLKKMMANKLPTSVLNRPKQPYRAPIASALLSGDTRLTNELTDPSIIRQTGIFNEQSVSQLLNKMTRAPFINEVDSMALMTILTTHLIDKLFIRSFNYLDDEQTRRGVVRYCCQE